MSAIQTTAIAAAQATAQNVASGNGAVQTAPEVVAQTSFVNQPSMQLTSAFYIPNRNVPEYFELIVDTTDPSIVADQKIVLFDSAMMYQTNMPFTMDPAVKIIGQTTNYQSMLNYFVPRSPLINRIRLTVCDPSNPNNQACALSQFGKAVDVVVSDIGSNQPYRQLTFFPSQYTNSGQYHLYMVDIAFKQGFKIEDLTAIVYNQEKGLKVTWGFYTVAEFGNR